MGVENYRNTKFDNGDTAIDNCSSSFRHHGDQIERFIYKIMPIDLAIERELAYRMRVDKVQSRSQAPERSQRSAPALNRSMVERKRKTLPNQPSPSLEGLKSFKPDSMRCQICNVPCCGMASFKQHREGKKHAARIQEIMTATRSKEKTERNTKAKWDKMEWEMVV
ncbi:hypothetical protein ACHQM5_006474 [Ranunculus cassubicifolius]